jgi:hypothetical protein
MIYCTCKQDLVDKLRRSAIMEHRFGFVIDDPSVPFFGLRKFLSCKLFNLHTKVTYLESQNVLLKSLLLDECTCGADDEEFKKIEQRKHDAEIARWSTDVEVIRAVLKNFTLPAQNAQALANSGLPTPDNTK